MQQHIPDDLGQEVAKLAAGLKLNLDQAVRDALEEWIKRRQNYSQLLPDACFITDEMGVPFDLPLSECRAVRVVKGNPMLPDGVGLD